MRHFFETFIIVIELVIAFTLFVTAKLTKKVIECLNAGGLRFSACYMLNPEYKDARWSEVQDGQKNWEQPKLCPGDDDRFRTEYVDPLKQLQAEGRFEITIVTHNQRGRPRVPIAVRIVSAINYG